MIGTLYDWAIGLAQCRPAHWPLAAVGFVDSAIFAILPDRPILTMEGTLC